MNPFSTVTSVVTPLSKVNVDTDQIIPKQFLKIVTKSGFGEFLFFDWRYGKHNEPIPDFVLNDSRYGDSHILVTGDNFGCGSSREHAVWSLLEYGFSVVVAPSFANIFYSNCFKNGLLPIALDCETVEELQQERGDVTVDLRNQIITIASSGRQIPFQIEPEKKRILLEGLDDITQTLRYDKEISEFEKSSKIPSLL